MNCVITHTPSTAKEDFKSFGADRVLPDLNGVNLSQLFAGILKKEDSVVTISSALDVEVRVPGWTPQVATGFVSGWTPHFAVKTK